MSAAEMAVVAPSYDSGAIVSAAHVPEVVPPTPKAVVAANGDDSDDEMPFARKAPNGGGAKRAVMDSSSDEDERPLAKKARQSTGSVGVKRRRVVESGERGERRGALAHNSDQEGTCVYGMSSSSAV